MDTLALDEDELTRQFIDSRASQIHSTFGVEAHFNSSMSRYELKEFHELTQVLEEVKADAPKLVDYLEVDPTECTWEDVLIELERAREAADLCEQRSRKFYRRPFRWLGDHAHLISPGLSAFPDEFGIIHGGLAVVLSIARHREQVRFKLLRAIETIPNAIHTAQSKERNFPKDETNLQTVLLHRYLDDMRLTLLRTLPKLIKRLNPGSLFGKATNIVKGANIDHFLAEISSSAENVIVCAQGLSDDRNADMYKTVKDTHGVATRTRGGVEQLQTQVDEVLRRQKSLQSQLDAISGKNWLFQFLREYSRPQSHHQSHKPSLDSPGHPTSHLSPGSESAGPRLTTTPFELLNILSVSHLTALDDEVIILKRGRDLPDEALARTASMVRTRELQNLLHSPEPGAVLVDGCADKAQIARISPVSFVCAGLSQTLRQNLTPVLVFFCGRHVGGDPNDDLEGPQGLVRGLLSQLVLLLVQNGWMGDAENIALPISLSASPTATAGDELYSEETTILGVPDLCQLFHSLLGLIPMNTAIFCIVDGMTYYARENWRGDYDLVLAMFGDIVTDSNLGCLFKVLLTSPTNRMNVPTDLLPHQKIALRGARVGSSRHGLGAGLGRRFTQQMGLPPGGGWKEGRGTRQEMYEGRSLGQSADNDVFSGASDFDYYGGRSVDCDLGERNLEESNTPLRAQYGRSLGRH
ncbi:hypothetical protein V8F20_004946 [Naviculisporaceae sp. PSN 640]